MRTLLHHRTICALLVCFYLSFQVKAQTPTDGFAMAPGQICWATWYQQDQWNHYWEGTLYRDNPNLGTVTARSVQNMFALGLAKGLNLMGSLPWIKTEASQGVMAGHRGWQDLGLWLKYKPYDHKWKELHRLRTYISAGFMLPASPYYPDLLPLSIGLGSKQWNGNAMLHYVYKDHWFAHLQGGYSYRYNIELERINYYTDRGYDTDQLAMSDVANGSFSLGYESMNFRLEGGYMIQNTLGGTDIRRNDAPIPSNSMDMHRVFLMTQYRMPFHNNLGIVANVGYVLQGRNVGRTFGFGLGVLYQLGLWGNHHEPQQ